MDIKLYERVAKRVEYNKETGEMLWKFDPAMPKNWNSRYAGKQAGCKGVGGRYIHVEAEIEFDIRTRRLAWFIVHGKIEGFIAVINGDVYDDRLCNLKSVEYLETRRKGKLPKTNTSGVIGVRFKANRWEATVQVYGSSKGNTKRFKIKSDAEAWVKQRRLELGFDPDLHGRS